MSRRTYNGEDPVVGVDIDGTLGRYHVHFLEFAAAWLGKDPEAYWPGPKAVRHIRTLDGGALPFGDDDYDGSCPLNEFMGITKATYRRCKLAYRQGGLKRSMPVYPGARDMLMALRRKAWVVLCTTRPYLHLSNIEPDTIEFLSRNRLPYDDLIMGEHKYRDLRRRYPRVAAVVDDDPALLSQARSVSPPIPALFMARAHNANGWNSEPWWEGSCEGARITLLDHIKKGDWVLGIQPSNEENYVQAS